MIALKKKTQPKQAWIIHGFRGKPEQAAQLTSLGFFLSFGFNHNEKSLQKTPPDKIFLETDDSNYTIQDVYRKAALILNISVQDLVQQIEQNIESNFYF
jgi:TatD DNase family protein